MLLAHDISMPVVSAGRFETNNKRYSFPEGTGEHSLMQDIMDGITLSGDREKAIEKKFHNDSVS